MAAKKKITGITIEISGDTTQLDKALTAVDKQSKTTQTALKEVNRLLKLDPTNTELLRQKQELLAQSLDQTTQKAEALRTAIDQHTGSDLNYQKWEKAQAPLQGALTKTKEAVAALLAEQEKLEELGFAPDSAPMREVEIQLEKTKGKAEALQAKMDALYESLGRPVSIEQYDALKRELIGVEQQAEAAQQAVDGFSASSATFQANMDGVASKASGVSSAMAPVTKAIAAVGAAALATVPATDQLRTGLSMLDATAAAAGVSAGTIDEALHRLNAVSGDTDASIEAIANLLQSGFDDNTLLDAVNELSGAVILFPETLKIESLADSLQETLATGEATGQYAELLERLGVDLEDVNKNLNQTTDAEQKQMYAMQELSRNGLGELTQSWAANNQELIANSDSTLDFQLASARLAETILPLMTSLTDMASGLVDWFAQLPDGVQKTIIVVAALIALISPVAGIIASIATAMGGFATASAAAAAGGAAVSMTLGDWLIIIAAVVAAVAGLIALLNVLFGKKDQVENMDVDSLTSSSGTKAKVRGYATGGVFEPNSPMLIGVGDNTREREVIAPESMLRETFSDAVRSMGGGRSQTTVKVQFTGSLAQLGRLLQPVITTETARQGGTLAPGTGGTY